MGRASHVYAISDILHEVSPLFSWRGTHALPVLLSLQPWVSTPVDAGPTLLEENRDAKISPRALSPWTLQLASFILPNPRATSHPKHCRYICWDTGELNALFNLVYCQFLALSNLTLQEVLRTMCPFLRGISRRPLQAPVLSKYSLSKLKGSRPWVPGRWGDSQTCLQDPTLPPADYS